MLNKKVLTAAVTAALLTGTGFVQAEEQVQEAIVTGDTFIEGFTISANVALTSDYKFRGISQSNGDGALQGGFDAGFGPGFYVGAWGSTVNFDTNDGGCCNGSLELDYYGGWAHDIGDSDFSVDVGYIYYSYPGDNDSDAEYQEVYAKGSWKFLTLGVAYSDDYYLETDEFWYAHADMSFTLPWDIALDMHAGYNMLEETKYDADGNVTDGGFLATDEDAFTDYSISLTKSWASVDWAVAYVGTDLDDEDVFDTNWGDGKAVISMSKSF